MIRRFLLRLSIARGIRRQRMKRLVYRQASRLGWESRRASFNRIDAFKGERM